MTANDTATTAAATTTNNNTNNDYCDKAITELVNETNLNKIESFFEDTAYKEAIESSSNFNSRLCRERRLRMPFLDSQTGVAQYHSALFVTERQRMPGLTNGQIYTYPSKRWRKKRRQYLINFFQPRKIKMDIDDGLDIHTENLITGASEDSKDSLALKDEHSKDAWYYDEQDMLDLDPYDEPDPDSDYDYEESYSKRKRRKPRGGGHHPSRGHPPSSDSPAGRRSKGGGRGRRKANYDPSDSDKPFVCDLCSARYKTRPGLVYHYGHSHSTSSSGDPHAKELSPSPADVESRTDNTAAASDQPGGSRRGRGGNSVRASSPSTMNTSAASPGGTPNLALQPQVNIGPPISGEFHHGPPMNQLGNGQNQGETPPPGSPNSGMLGKDGGPMPGPGEPGPVMGYVDEPHLGHHHHAGGDAKKDKPVTPSPYCDFCLGNARENKKTGGSEELVSCSDCGRSGHPTCLQFTTNMIVSVRKYKWQCIECKCCSVCGTSDNDDQLLFCDDCDRGYHMYCLDPPLSAPPEGSWSCKLCISEFHHGVPKVP